MMGVTREMEGGQTARGDVRGPAPRLIGRRSLPGRLPADLDVAAGSCRCPPSASISIIAAVKISRPKTSWTMPTHLTRELGGMLLPLIAADVRTGTCSKVNRVVRAMDCDTRRRVRSTAEDCIEMKHFANRRKFAHKSGDRTETIQTINTATKYLPSKALRRLQTPSRTSMTPLWAKVLAPSRCRQLKGPHCRPPVPVCTAT